MALARAAAERAKASADKTKGKRGLASESDDEMLVGKKRRDEAEEEESEEEDEDDAASSSSEVAVAKVDAKTKVKEGNAELEAYERDLAAIKAKIDDAKKKNASALHVLSKTRDDFPVQVSFFNLAHWDYEN